MKKKRYVLILLVIVISIGFAVLTANLNLNGSFSFNESKFDIYFDNLTIDDFTIDSPEVKIKDKTSFTINGSFNNPGNYVEFSFYAINDGTIDAVLSNIEIIGIDSSIEKYFIESIKDSAGNEVSPGSYLQAGSAKKLTIRIEYNYDIEEFITIEKLKIEINILFTQPEINNKKSWNYEYINQEQYFIAPKIGAYKLEVWGAGGGNIGAHEGSYGGYSEGTVYLSKGQKIYINTGGAGKSMDIKYTNNTVHTEKSYNGGGSGTSISNTIWSGGGGATHIATTSGLLSTLENNIDSILIVAGGGGGIGYFYGSYKTGGHGGGYMGNDIPEYVCGSVTISQINGGGQSALTGGTFGIGGNSGSGGGSGFYGGTAGWSCGGAASGGSGYIGNNLLSEKNMYCYNCKESSDISTKTISTTNVSSEAISHYAKKGNGYVRITLI